MESKELFLQLAAEYGNIKAQILANEKIEQRTKESIFTKFDDIWFKFGNSLGYDDTNSSDLDSKLNQLNSKDIDVMMNEIESDIKSNDENPATTSSGTIENFNMNEQQLDSIHQKFIKLPTAVQEAIVKPVCCTDNVHFLCCVLVGV